VTDLTPNPEDFEDLDACVILANPFDDTQVRALTMFVMVMDTLGGNAPPLFLLVHTASPELADADDIETSGKPIRELLQIGLDGVIEEELESFSLVVTVRALIAKTAALSKSLNNLVNQRHQRMHYSNYLKESIHSIMWDYLRTRIGPSSIPPVDYDLPSGVPAELDGYTFGAVLGKGMYGMVYRVAPPGQDPDSAHCQVMKVMDKASYKDVPDLKNLKSMADVMQLLSQPHMRHPNTIRLHQVYHSPTHLYFRMEYAGSENLFHRLVQRDKPSEHQRPVSFGHTVSVISQMLDVIRHLHLQASVAHRDIKPENMIVTQTDARVVLKLVDFDLAIIQSGTKLCRKPCGTIPFISPEVLLGAEYCGMAADVWAIGIVFFEILCGVLSIERLFNLSKISIDAKRVDDGSRKAIAEAISGHFKDPGAARLLQDNCKAELRPLLEVIEPLIAGMLTVNVKERWKTRACTEIIAQLPLDE